MSSTHSALGHLAAAATAVLGLALAPAAARACSVCQAGDPAYSSFGANAQQVGTYSVFFEVTGSRKTSGLLPHGDTGGHDHADHDHEDGAADHEHGSGEEPGHESLEAQQLNLYLTATPLDRLTLTLQVPYKFNTINEKPQEESDSRSTLSGFGDLALTASYVLWRNREVLPSTWFEARAFGKAPTGASHREVSGVEDPHLQTGTGSWDFGGGLAAVHRFEWGSLYASGFYRVNTEGSLDYEYGNAFLANLAVDAPLGHLLGEPYSPFTPALELNFRYAGKDVYQGSLYDSSGGSILYLTPSLRVRLPWYPEDSSASLRMAMQIPLTQSWLHGQQHEGFVWSAGMLIAF